MENLGDILKSLDATRNAQSSGSASFESSEEDGGSSVYELPEHACERCGDRGWFTPDVPAGHPEFGKIVTCECQSERLSNERSARLFRYSNLGQLTRFTFDTLDPDGISDDPLHLGGDLLSKLVDEPSTIFCNQLANPSFPPAFTNALIKF